MKHSTPLAAGSLPYPMLDQVSHRAYVTLLFNKHRIALQRYLCRMVPPEDAAELVQESYYRLLRHGEMVRIEALARSFLFQTATNLARDHHRRRLSHRAAQHVQIDDCELPEEHQGPDEQLTGEQTYALLERALDELPQQTRNVFLLHRFGDRSYPQIAAAMNLSVRTVARKMADAVEHLSAVLESTP
ncbi:MAG TPA: RNA polymerase sigma factor [Steroidobacteraceae bacterium]|nr:RNA polymerase sigma factor [Steroidobacteraceae bacterium]